MKWTLAFVVAASIATGAAADERRGATEACRRAATEAGWALQATLWCGWPQTPYFDGVLAAMLAACPAPPMADHGRFGVPDALWRRVQPSYHAAWLALRQLAARGVDPCPGLAERWRGVAGPQGRSDASASPRTRR
jgi:hypothetical protein